MVTEQSHERHLTQIYFDEREEILVTNWRHQIAERRLYFYREKPQRKPSIKERRFNTKAKIEKTRRNFCYIKIVENIGPVDTQH